MIIGIILIIMAIIGMMYGIENKSKSLEIASAVILIVIASIGFYFYINPY